MESGVLTFGIFTAVLDILIVAFMIYALIRLFSHSEKTVVIVNTLLVITIGHLTANLLDLDMVKIVFNTLFSWVFLIIFVVFQPEIRKALDKLGTFNKFFFQEEHEAEGFIDSLSKACFKMKENNLGALITLEKDVKLDEYTKKSVKLDANFDGTLLEAIFQKDSPLHDGAVVIQKTRLMYASTYYPIALDINLTKEFGTRHRAGMTISRETDSITIIISEERKSLSIAYNGKIYADIDEDFFKEFMKEKLY